MDIEAQVFNNSSLRAKNRRYKMNTTDQQEEERRSMTGWTPSAIIKHLNGRQDSEVIDGLLQILLSHENRYHRETAAYVLKPRHEKRVTDALIRASSLERDDDVFYAIIGALIGRDDEDVLSVIMPHIEQWNLPLEYFLHPHGILDDDFQKRKHWGEFDKKKAIAMVEGMGEEWWCYE